MNRYAIAGQDNKPKAAISRHNLAWTRLLLYATDNKALSITVGIKEDYRRGKVQASDTGGTPTKTVRTNAVDIS